MMCKEYVLPFVKKSLSNVAIPWKLVILQKWYGFLHQTSTSVFAIVSGSKGTKFHVTSTSVFKVSIYAIHETALMLWRWADTNLHRGKKSLIYEIVGCKASHAMHSTAARSARKAYMIFPKWDKLDPQFTGLTELPITSKCKNFHSSVIYSAQSITVG